MKMSIRSIMGALFLAVVGPFMADEVKTWSVWLHKKMRHMAVAKLPPESRERYEEEWESGLDEIPGEIFKLVYSIGLLRAAVGIRNAVPKSSVRFESLFSRLKRLFDIGFSGIILFLLSPMLLAISIAIKLDSDGPIFYASQFRGKKGRVFHLLKFRTIACGAEKQRAEIAHMNGRGGLLF
jgi:hypothetical protein